MKQSTSKDFNLQEVLRLHELWLRGKNGGVRADLSGMNLCGINLHGANLREAILVKADLSRANLHEADLFGAHMDKTVFVCADLSFSNMRHANAESANFSHACLNGANLRAAELVNSLFIGAALYDACLMESRLYGADFSGAYLGGSNFTKAQIDASVQLDRAHLDYTTVGLNMECPASGAFIAWKKAAYGFGDVIVKLLIPEDALRSGGTTRKCRASKATVLEIQDYYGTRLGDDVVAHSFFDSDFEYAVGKTVSVDNFDIDRWTTCSTGIHFFMDRHDAVTYR